MIVPLSTDSRVILHTGDHVVVVSGTEAVVLNAAEWRELARTLNRWAAQASRKAALEAIKQEIGPKGAPSPEPPEGPNGPAVG